jgi:NAD(P)-dependent dehydrogenase (short-subunit alcohol dehydrogenase family)
MMFGLEKKVAIVTGAGRGIGKAIALGMAEAGANVVVSARTQSAIEHTAAEIKARDRQALAVSVDVRRAEDVQNMVERTVERFGRVDILVNNAGGTFSRPLLEISENGWNTLVSENLTSVFLCSTAVVRAMIKKGNGGAIINMASVAGMEASLFAGPYGACKAAVINLTLTMAAEWARYGIRVNAISPGMIETGTAQSPRWPPGMDKEIPIGRVGVPQDIVGAAIYLASDAASFATGTNLVVHGGAKPWNWELVKRLGAFSKLQERAPEEVIK